MYVQMPFKNEKKEKQVHFVIHFPSFVCVFDFSANNRHTRHELYIHFIHETHIEHYGVAANVLHREKKFNEHGNKNFNSHQLRCSI